MKFVFFIRIFKKKGIQWEHSYEDNLSYESEHESGNYFIGRSEEAKFKAQETYIREVG